MANQLSLTIGANTISVPIKLDDAKLGALILRYAAQKIIPTDGLTNAQIVRVVLRDMMRTAADVATDRQRADLINEYQTTIEATITSDNDIAE